MDFTFKNNHVHIDSDKKEIILSEDGITLDGMAINMAGEYEKSGCLMYVYDKNDEKIYHFRTEWYWVGYIPNILTDISAEALDFLGTLDVLVMPGAKTMQPVLEKIEPRLLVTYGETSHEIATVLGGLEPVQKYRMKEADLSSEKTGCVTLTA